jgi:hypothetical protein
MTIPPRPSLGAFVALAMLMVVLSYVMTILLAIACVYLPWLLVKQMSNAQTIPMLVAGAPVSLALWRSLVEGMLLDPEQRVARAHTLFGAALGFALDAQGWAAHHRPGVLFFERGGCQINPFDLVTHRGWAVHCGGMG